MMSLYGHPQYIGEAKNLKSRTKQQFNPKTSTSYKSYLKTVGSKSPEHISAFELRVLPTRVGRKELEEFGIVNLPAPLNRFHRDKRSLVGPTDTPLGLGDWQVFQSVSEQFMREGESIIAQRPKVPWSDSKPDHVPGLYLVFSDNERPIYIGESTNICERFVAHSSRTYFSALRRNIGRDIFGFQYIPGKKKRFLPQEDTQVTAHLGACQVSNLTVLIGRLELEEYLIGKHQPALNRKNRRS